MNIVEAIILAVIQGITEWFPVSSSGHLVIGEKLLNLQSNIQYDVMLHIGSLIVILFVFRTDIIELLKVLVGRGTKEYKRLFLFLLLGSIPIAIIGFFFRRTIEAAFNSLIAVAILLFITGLFLYLSKRKTTKKALSSKNAVIIGLAQAVAVLPGISRSGITISTGMMLGVNREKAARFSFLLFIPAIIGAMALQIPKVQLNDDFKIMLLGTFVTIIVSYFALTWLLKIIKLQKFHYFAYYCWGLAFIIMLLTIQNGL